MFHHSEITTSHSFLSSISEIFNAFFCYKKANLQYLLFYLVLTKIVRGKQKVSFPITEMKMEAQRSTMASLGCAFHSLLSFLRLLPFLAMHHTKIKSVCLLPASFSNVCLWLRDCLSAQERENEPDKDALLSGSPNTTSFRPRCWPPEHFCQLNTFRPLLRALLWAILSNRL